ncbi:MAG: MBOAT family protein [Acidimicrobiales bacterium]|nr:MBOAT family protein [Acidimicrobiales bacterium]
MLFPTVEFAIFFSIVFVACWLLRPFPLPWRLFMLAASYVFYCWWDWHYGLLLAGSTLANHLAARAIHATRDERGRRAILIGAVAANLAALGWFKYYGFFASSVVGGLRDVGLDVAVPLVQVVLPVGISFFTFMALSYVIDTYRRELSPPSLLDFALYLAFFPHLVAGPIVRASELLPQFALHPDPRRLDSAQAFRLIVAGMFKKVVVSSFLAGAIVDRVFAAPASASSLEILFAIYAYAIQIYADFSGYTDIAIGCALLLGFRFPQNFDAPYTSRSVQEFWRRWHMSLSRWLRDYLYVPLGGNRGSTLQTYRNLMLTMLLGGLWHGASWTFVVWGGIHGSALCVDRWQADRHERRGLGPVVDTPARAVLRWFVAFHVVCLAWVFFRAETLTAAWQLLTRLFTAWGPAPLVTPLLVATIVAMLAAQFVPPRFVLTVQSAYSRFPWAVQGAILGGAFLLIDSLGPVGVAPFIYFQF